MTLADLIAADPDGRGYATMTDAQVAADLMVQRHTRRRPVPWETYFTHIWTTGIQTRIVDKSEETPDPLNPAQRAAVALCQKIVRNARDARQTGGIATIDMDAAVNRAWLDGLVSVGVLSATERAALLALADVPCSLADLHRIPVPVYPETVARARGMY